VFISEVNIMSQNYTLEINNNILYCTCHLTMDIITCMVLYSIIKPYNCFFVINRHIARQNFILNDLFSGG
jgi:hypothetical protein